MDSFEALFIASSHLTVDDAGVRCIGPGASEWVSFASLADAEAGWNLFGQPFLRLVSRDGRRRIFRVMRDELLDTQEAILRGLRDAKPVPTSDGVLLSVIGRAGRPLMAWLGAVSAWAGGNADYRSSAVDHAALIGTLSDASADVELRAACIHAALASADEPDLVAIATMFVERALPPLVVVAARLGRGGAALVPDGMIDDVAPLLGAEDRSALVSAMAAPVTHEGEARVHEIMATAARDVIAQQTKSHSSRARHLHARTLGGYADQQGVSRFK